MHAPWSVRRLSAYLAVLLVVNGNDDFRLPHLRDKLEIAHDVLKRLGSVAHTNAQRLAGLHLTRRRGRRGAGRFGTAELRTG